MSLIHSPTIITDGLIAYLDAANPRSKPIPSGIGLFGERYIGYFGDDVNWFSSATKHGGYDYTTDFSTFTSSADLYTWMWYGYFLAPTTGTYTFYTNSDDSSLVWLGDNAVSGYTLSNLLVDNRGLHGGQERSGTINLTANTYYPIRVIFGENYGGDYVQLSFSGPNIARTYNGLGYFFNGNKNFKDLISSYNGITYNNPIFLSSNQGSISFNSNTSDYYYLGTNIIPWDSGQSFSISLWFKTSSNGILFGQTGSQTSTPNGAGGWVPAIYIDSNGKLRTSCFWGGTDNPPSITPSAVNNNAWHNITVTYGSGVQKSYLDGVLYDTWTKSQNYYSATYSYFLGGGFGTNWNNLTNNYFTGLISTFFMYNKTLSQDEITQNFNALGGRYGV